MKNILILMMIVIVMGACVNHNAEVAELDGEYEVGKVVEVEDNYGKFYIYVPETRLNDGEILVIVHGTPAKEETTEETARYYLEKWLGYSENTGNIIIAPAFNQEDFSSRYGEIEDAMTGYRGLFGREIGADEWVLRIVKSYQQALDMSEQTFNLYGHSAGGQFVGRFLVRHPEYVRKAVISAAATYPQPDTTIAWPFGMGELSAEIEWDEKTTESVTVLPDGEKWLEATQLDVTVIVGMNDTAGQPERPGQRGTNRITIGRNWVEAMKEYAQEQGKDCGYEFEMIPGKGHSMSGLIEYIQLAMMDK